MFLGDSAGAAFPETQSDEMRAYSSVGQTGGMILAANFDQIYADNMLGAKLLPGSTVTTVVTIDPGMGGIYVISFAGYRDIDDASTSNGTANSYVVSATLGTLCGSTDSVVGFATVADLAIPVAGWCGYLPDRDTLTCYCSGNSTVTQTLRIDGASGWFHIIRLGDLAP